MDKSQLELEKINLEIKELKRHWLKKPQYLQVLLPTTLAIFSLMYAISSGLFSSKQELLELKKQRLESEVLAFEKEKQDLTKTNENLKNEIGKYNDSLKDRNLVLKKYENSFNAERLKLEALNVELNSLKTTKEDYNSQIALLEKDYNDKKEKYVKEIESKYYKEIDNDKQMKELQQTIEGNKTQIENLKYNIELYKSNPFVKAGKNLEYNKWVIEKMIQYYDSKGKKYDETIKQLESELKEHEKRLDTQNVKEQVRKIKS